ncbi:hypothetical protein [Reyranella sp.]|uniref:hypothetical protein n=1 Tax=Reyranella sp. TaxID=1929291 RepID=UPI00121F38A8|nr:hypothetical protein [Reyranella sp.]TAJ89895.1 MAG: hypothetical protein EPO50_05945 [Reyranella sp.]
MKNTLATIAMIAATGVAGIAYAQITQPAQPGTALPGGTSNPRTGLPTTTPNATAGEAAAKAQLEARGYTGVKQLTRDTAGNWTGKAMRNNVELAVTLDTAGNVKEQ